MTETEKLLWCWVRAIYLTMTDEQKKEFTKNLSKEIVEWRMYDHLSGN